MNVLSITGFAPNGEPLREYAQIINGAYFNDDPEKWFIGGICDGNRKGFATWIEAARYVNLTWPDMPIQGSVAV